MLFVEVFIVIVAVCEPLIAAGINAVVPLRAMLVTVVLEVESNVSADVAVIVWRVKLSTVLTMGEHIPVNSCFDWINGKSNEWEDGVKIWVVAVWPKLSALRETESGGVLPDIRSQKTVNNLF